MVSAYSTQRNKEIIEEQDLLYKKYPRVKDVIDMSKPHDLSKEEYAALISVYTLQNGLIALEMQDVKGCGDCVGFLKQMKLL